MDTRKRAEFVFPDGKVGFFDFAGEQYFNYFRTHHLTLQGDCGEVHDQQELGLVRTVIRSREPSRETNWDSILTWKATE